MKKWINRMTCRIRNHIVIASTVLALSLMALGAVTDLVVDENGICSRAVNFINQIKISHGLYLNQSAVWNYSDNEPWTFGNLTKAGSADIIAGIDDAKYVTAKAMYDADIRASMWTLVERKTFSSAATSYTFSGLNGDTDRRYLVKANIIPSGALGVFVAPNSDQTASNYKIIGHYGNGTTLTESANSSIDGIVVLTGRAANALAVGTTEISARTGTARISENFSTELTSDSAIAFYIHWSAIWTNTADNITALLVFSNVTGGIKAGSYIELWKLAQ